MRHLALALLFLLGAEGCSKQVPHADGLDNREFRFADFVIDVPADESKFAVLTHDLAIAESFGVAVAGTFPWEDGLLYRVETRELSDYAIALLSSFGIASEKPHTEAACSLADYQGLPVRRGGADGAVSFGMCVRESVERIKLNAACVVMLSAALNPDTEVFDLESSVVCDETSLP